MADTTQTAGKNKELEKLIAALQTGNYTPLSAEDMQARAQSEYQTAYDQQRLSARQGYETADAALEKQLGTLGSAYDKQREQTADEYARAYSQADRMALSRGMQRSSYNNQTLANLSAEGAEAQREILDAETQAASGIAGDRALLARQLAQQLQQYDAGQAADVLNRIRDLEDREYERGTANAQYQNQLAAMIYEYENQQKSADSADEKWLAEFNENVRQYNIAAGLNADGTEKPASARVSTSQKQSQSQTPAGSGDGDLWSDLGAGSGAGSGASSAQTSYFDKLFNSGKTILNGLLTKATSDMRQGYSAVLDTVGKNKAKIKTTSVK